MSLKKFLTGDTNTFNFSLKASSKTHINIIIDGEFEFSVSLPDLVVSSHDDYLFQWTQEVNTTKPQDLDNLLLNCTKLYCKLMELDEKDLSPLYKGQEVYELDNDNNDIKFISRVRISEDNFNQDLLLNCFAFLAPQNTANLMRVSKQWYKLIQKDALWKQYCFNSFGVTDLTHDTWMQEFLDKVSSKPRFIQKWMTSSVKFNIKEPRNLTVTDGVYVLSKSNHLTFQLDFDKLNQSTQGNPPNIGFGLIPKKLIPKDFDEIGSLFALNLSGTRTFTEFGYIFWCLGNLYSKNKNGQPYSHSIILFATAKNGAFGSTMCIQTFGNRPGQTVGVFYDPNANTISYHVDGKDCGVAFDKVDDEEFYPIIVCGSDGKIGRSHQVDVIETPRRYKFENQLVLK